MTDLLVPEVGPLDSDAPPPAPSLLADILASLNVNVGKMAAALKEQADLQRKLQRAPVTNDVYGQGQYTSFGGTAVPATGPLVLSLGGPEVGRKWLVRALRVTDGGNVATAVAGAAAFYVGQMVPPSGNLATWVPGPVSQLAWPFLNLPNAITFSGGVIQVTATNQLFCVVTAGTPTQSILAAATIEDIDLVALSVVETV